MSMQNQLLRYFAAEKASSASVAPLQVGRVTP